MMKLNLGGSGFNMNFGNMFTKKDDEEDKLLGDVAAQPEALAGGATGSVDPVATQPMSDTQPTGNTVPIDDSDPVLGAINTKGLSEDYNPNTGSDVMNTGGAGAGVNAGFTSTTPIEHDPGFTPVPGATNELPPSGLDTGLGGGGIVDPGITDPDKWGGMSPGYDPNKDPIYYEDRYINPLVGEIRGRGQDDYSQQLQAYASGQEMSPVVQQQMERAQQSALAAAASARGMPVSATQRLLQSGMDEAGRVGMETAAAQQMEFANMVNQLEKSRDDTVANLIAMGVDRDKAVLDANTKLELQKKDLATKIFLGRLGSGTEIIKAGIADASWGESGSENIAENAGLLNLMLAAPGPAGIDAPTQRILTNKQQDPDALFFVQTTLPDGSQGQGSMKYDPTTGTYALTTEAGTLGGYENAGIFDDQGSPVQVFRKWNPEDNRYDYAYEPITGGSTYQGQLTGEGQPYATAPSWVTNEEEYREWLEGSMHYGESSLPGDQAEPVGNLTPIGGNLFTDENGQTWSRQQLVALGLMAPEGSGGMFGFGDPPQKEYGDPMGRKEYGDLDPGRYIDTISPTSDPMRLRAGAMNPLMGASKTPIFDNDRNITGYTRGDNNLLGIGPSQLQLNKPSNVLKPQLGNLPDMKLKTGNMKLGDIRPGLKPLPGTSGGVSPWRERAKTGLSVGKEALGLANAAKDMVGARGTKQKQAAMMKLGTYAGTKALGYGFNKLADYIDGDAPDAASVTAEAADQVISDVADQTVEQGVKETLKEGAGELAEEATKAVVPEAAKETAKAAASEAGSGLLGAVKGAAPVVSALSAGKDLLGALGSKDPVGGIAGAGLKAGGAAAGAAAGSALGPIGSIIGGIAGSLAGGAAATPFQKKQQTMADYQNMEDPSRYIPEYGDPFGLGLGLGPGILANLLKRYDG